jgi:hypothetical protein
MGGGFTARGFYFLPADKNVQEHGERYSAADSGGNAA